MISKKLVQVFIIYLLFVKYPLTFILQCIVEP